MNSLQMAERLFRIGKRYTKNHPEVGTILSAETYSFSSDYYILKVKTTASNWEMLYPKKRGVCHYNGIDFYDL